MAKTSSGGRPDLVSTLVRSAFLVNEVYAESARGLGLTPQQGQLLCVLMARPHGMGELGGVLGLARSSLTGLVDRTAQRGLVRRGPGPGDARAVRVALTPEGTGLAELFYADARRRIDALTDGIGEAGRGALAELLDRMVEQNGAPVVFLACGHRPPTDRLPGLPVADRVADRSPATD